MYGLDLDKDKLGYEGYHESIILFASNKFIFKSRVQLLPNE